MNSVPNLNIYIKKVLHVRNDNFLFCYQDNFSVTKVIVCKAESCHFKISKKIYIIKNNLVLSLQRKKRKKNILM